MLRKHLSNLQSRERMSTLHRRHFQIPLSFSPRTANRRNMAMEDRDVVLTVSLQILVDINGRRAFGDKWIPSTKYKMSIKTFSWRNKAECPICDFLLCCQNIQQLHCLYHDFFCWSFSIYTRRIVVNTCQYQSKTLLLWFTYGTNRATWNTSQNRLDSLLLIFFYVFCSNKFEESEVCSMVLSLYSTKEC